MIDQICAAHDAIKEVRRKYAAGEATYDDMRAAAVALIELRQQAERARFGRARSKIDAVTIASLLR
jgi:hypothetical protein